MIFYCEECSDDTVWYRVTTYGFTAEFCAECAEREHEYLKGV